MCLCEWVCVCVCGFKRESDRRWTLEECKSACVCVCVVIGVIGAVGGVERQGVVAIEGKCRLVIGRCKYWPRAVAALTSLTAGWPPVESAGGAEDKYLTSYSLPLSSAHSLYLYRPPSSIICPSQNTKQPLILSAIPPVFTVPSSCAMAHLYMYAPLNALLSILKSQWGHYMHNLLYNKTPVGTGCLVKTGKEMC